MRLRALAKNTLVYAAGNAGLRAGAFLLIPLYTHALSMREYGMLATLLLTMQILGILMGMGARTAFMRFCAEFSQREQLGRLLGSAYVVVLTGGAVVTVVAMTLLRPLFAAVLHTGDPRFHVLLTCLAALAQTLWLLTVSYFRATNRGGMFVAWNAAAFALLIVTTVGLVLWLNLGVAGVLGAYLLSYGLMWLVVSGLIAARTGLGVNQEAVNKVAKFGFPLIFSMSGDVAVDTSALYAMSLFSGLDHVAIYSLGYKIAQIVIVTLILPFQLAYEPVAYGTPDSPALRRFIAEALIHLLLAFGVVAVGIVFVFKDFMRVVAPAQYAPAYGVVFALLPGVACMGIHYVGESLLFIPGKTGTSAFVVSGVAAVSVLLNFALIRPWGVYGAALVYDLAHLAMGVLLLGLGMKQYRIELDWRRFWYSLALPIAGLAAIWWLRSLPGELFYPMVLGLSAAALTAAHRLGLVDLRSVRRRGVAEHAA
ncbi:MAG: lipopolysaccharide biosynthesis protein [Candidatus Oleimicrobiaceae bacterium]